MKTPIVQVREKRKDIILILAIVVFLAASINLITVYLSIVLSDYLLLLVLLSALCVIIGGILLMRITFGATDHIVRINGAISFTTNDRKLEAVKIIGYSFNDHFYEYLNGFVSENDAYLKRFFDREPDDVPIDRFDPDDLNYITIVNSVVEFTILNHIDTHLNEYFLYNEIDSSKTVMLARDQLEPNVLKNRVIDQLTKDMKERSVFSDNEDSDTHKEGVTTYVRHDDGAVYQRLEIELPPKSRIVRNDNGYLVIRNPIFDLTLMPKYDGSLTYIPPILMPQEEKYVIPLLVSLKMVIRIKRTALFTRQSMEMYEWLDSLVEEMQDYISTDRLLKRLDPDLLELLTSKDIQQERREFTVAGVPKNNQTHDS